VKTMIKFIGVDTLLALRNDVLREGKLTLDECRFPTDEMEEAFHLGYFVEDELACIVSFHPQSCKDFIGVGYQLRGMATIEKYRGQGLGNQIVNFTLIYLRGKNAGYVWCNARKRAVTFYTNIGFEIISAEFDVPGIGPHYMMYVKLK